MAATPNVVDVDFEYEADRRMLDGLDDVTLIFVMLGLLGEMEGAPNWGRTRRARTMARMAFEEIGLRWVPLEIHAAALTRLLSDEPEAV